MNQCTIISLHKNYAQKIYRYIVFSILNLYTEQLLMVCWGINVSRFLPKIIIGIKEECIFLLSIYNIEYSSNIDSYQIKVKLIGLLVGIFIFSFVMNKYQITMFIVIKLKANRPRSKKLSKKSDHMWRRTQ